MISALGIPSRTEPAPAMLERDEEGILPVVHDRLPDPIEAFAGVNDLVMPPERCEDVDCMRKPRKRIRDS
jgi:hypothetical protein